MRLHTMTRGADRGRGPGAGSCGRLQRDFSLCGRALGGRRFADGERRRSCREQVRGDTGRDGLRKDNKRWRHRYETGKRTRSCGHGAMMMRLQTASCPARGLGELELREGWRREAVSEAGCVDDAGTGRWRSLELGEQPRNWRGRRANKQAPELASRGAHMVRKRGAVSSPLYRRHRP